MQSSDHQSTSVLESINKKIQDIKILEDVQKRAMQTAMKLSEGLSPDSKALLDSGMSLAQVIDKQQKKLTDTTSAAFGQTEGHFQRMLTSDLSILRQCAEELERLDKILKGQLQYPQSGSQYHPSQVGAKLSQEAVSLLKEKKMTHTEIAAQWEDDIVSLTLTLNKKNKMTNAFSFQPIFGMPSQNQQQQKNGFVFAPIQQRTTSSSLTPSFQFQLHMKGEEEKASSTRNVKEFSGMQLCDYLDTLEEILSLRPYPCIFNHDIENMIDKERFSVADFIAFAEGTEAYLVKKHGPATAVAISKSMDVIAFHKKLARLWNKLDPAIQEELGGKQGVPISSVKAKLSARLAELNKSNCCSVEKPATFSFENY